MFLLVIISSCNETEITKGVVYDLKYDHFGRNLYIPVFCYKYTYKDSIFEDKEYRHFFKQVNYYKEDSVYIKINKRTNKSKILSCFYRKKNKTNVCSKNKEIRYFYNNLAVKPIFSINSKAEDNKEEIIKFFKQKYKEQQIKEKEWVTFNIEINKNGEVKNPKIYSKNHILSEFAMKNAQKIIFHKPGYYNNQPVIVNYLFSIEF